MSFIQIFLALSFSLTALSQAPSVHQLASFPTKFVENIAARANGNILVTSLMTPAVLHLDPKHNVTTELPPIDGANGLSGIVEVSHDVFAVIAAEWNAISRRGEHFAIWTLDLRRSSDPVLRKIVDVVNTTALNSLTFLPGTSIVLASDSAAGVVYGINLDKPQAYSIVIKDEAFANTGGPSALGINGIRVHGSRLYFTNTIRGFFGYVPISTITGAATGSVQVIASFEGGELVGPDDFAIDDKDTGWIAIHPDKIVRVDCKGNQDIVVQGDEVPHPTGVVFARGCKKKTLYATTDLVTFDADGNVTSIDGLVVSVEVGAFEHELKA